MTSISYKLVPVQADFSYDTGHATVEEGYVDCAQGALDALLAWPMGDARPNGRRIDQYNATAVQKLFALYADLQLLRYGMANDLDEITLTDGDVVKQIDMGQYASESWSDFEEHLSGVVHVETNSDAGVWSLYLTTTPPDEATEDWILCHRGDRYQLVANKPWPTEAAKDDPEYFDSLDVAIVTTHLSIMEGQGWWPNLYVTENGIDYQQVMDFAVQDAND